LPPLSLYVGPPTLQRKPDRSALTGVAGYESTNAASLLNWQNTIATLAASALAPIFTGGRLKAGVEQAQAAYRGSLAQYERTVLTAYQEVEDQLAALHFLDNESQSESSAVSDARKAEQIAMQRYKPGLAGYLDVVYAQQSVLTNEQTADRSAVKVGRVSCADQSAWWRMARREHAMISSRTSIARTISFPCVICAAMLSGAQLAAQAVPAQDHVPSSSLLSNPPDARPPIVLTAINDPHTGKAAFLFKGREEPPVIRAVPGEDIRLTYVNAMATESREKCIGRPCTNMTNLHFHGLHVSPDAPQDDVISMMAMPGESLHYVVNIPIDQPPGLYWYHTHPHGESYQQDLDGMSGAIVIDGIERYIPELQHMRERILVLRDQVIGQDNPSSLELMHRVELSAKTCGTSTEAPERIFTVNGVLRPRVAITPGERQFWRIANASPDLYADLQVDGEQLEIVALDGMPLAFHSPEHPVEFVSHVLVPPAGRVEAIVTGPKPGAPASLRTRCFDTGSDGDPNPAMVLADMVNAAQPAPKPRTAPADARAPISRPLSLALIAQVENSSPDFVVNFSEDKQGFYINGRKYLPSDPPMTAVSIGAFHHWRVTNETHEVHPFHIHQVHFLVYAQNGVSLTQPEWLDTVNVPVEGNVDLVMDFTDPIIRGVSLFHCHLLSHEDKGMMAKILFK